MTDLQQTVTRLVTSFDGGGPELSRYELAAAQHTLAGARGQAPDPGHVDWWQARIGNRLHFMDTGEYWQDPPAPQPAPAVLAAERHRQRTQVAGTLLGVVLLAALLFLLAAAF